MPDLLALPFLICAVVACIAGMVRGFAGFGAAMVMTPIFSALYGPAVGVALCLMLEIAVALPVVPGVVRLVDWRRIGLLLVAAAVGVPLGNLVLTWAEPEPMRWAISAIVLGAVALLASGWRYTGQPRAGDDPGGRRQQRLPQRPGRHGRPADRLLLPRRSTKARHTCGPTSRPISCSSISWPSRPLPRAAWSTGTRSCSALFLAPAVMLGGVLGARLFPLASESFYRRLALVLLVGVAIGALIL